MSRFHRLDGPAVALLAVLVWIVGHPVLDLFWTYDDPFLLRWTEKHSVLQAFADPAAARGLPFRLLTPLLFTSFELDLAWFGRDPAAFYGHQLVVLALAVTLLYAASRLWLPPVFAAFAGVLFLLGSPTASWFQQLMTRHYVEGLAWAAVATVGFVLALRRDRWAWQIPAAAATALAMCAKEVYVPLPLLLLVLPEGSLRRRLRHVAPHGLVLVAYPIWRWTLLGTLGGGYAWVPDAGDVLALPLALGRWMVGAAPAWGLATTIGVGLLGIIGAWVHRPGRWLLPVALVLTLSPLVPVAESPEPRVAVLPWTVLAVSAAFGLRGVWARRSPAWAVGLAVGLLVCLVPAHRTSWGAEYATMEHMSGEARAFVGELDSGDLLAWPATPRGTLTELARVRRSRGMSAAGWFADDLYLCLHETVPQRVLAWRSAARNVVDVTGEIPSRRRRFCRAVDWRAPLRVELEPRGETLSWRLGPWREGRWFLVTGDGRNRYEVPRQATFVVGEVRSLRLRVRFDSPRGWTTYSPELAVSFDPPSGLVWER